MIEKLDIKKVGEGVKKVGNGVCYTTPVKSYLLVEKINEIIEILNDRDKERQR